MNTQVQTIPVVAPVAELAPLAWSVTKKSGDVVRKVADCATSQVFAPKAARLADGQAKDIAQLLAGTYRPVLRTLDAKLTDKEKLALWSKNVNVSQEKPSKADMVPFCTAVAALWVNAKGEKAALRATLLAYIDAVTESVPAIS